MSKLDLHWCPRCQLNLPAIVEHQDLAIFEVWQTKCFICGSVLGSRLKANDLIFSDKGVKVKRTPMENTNSTKHNEFDEVLQAVRYIHKDIKRSKHEKVRRCRQKT